jgi:hypothetical protein
MENITSIDTRIANVKIDANNIIIITVIEAAAIDEFDILDLNLVIRNLGKHLPVLKLVDARVSWTISLTAKARALQEDHLNKTIARAIIVSNSIKKGIFTFLKQFENKHYPQKYFTDYDEAYQWLLNFK